MKRLEELYNSMQGLQTLEEKKNECNHELQWAYVNEIEKVQAQHFYVGQVPCANTHNTQIHGLKCKHNSSVMC